MEENQEIPERLNTALKGLVKAGILTEAQLGLLILSAQKEEKMQQYFEGPHTSFVDILWDKVTVLRAQSEVSWVDNSRKARRRRPKGKR